MIELLDTFTMLLIFVFLPMFVLSLITAPIGCLMVWRKFSYAGDAMSHGVLLGVACSLILKLPVEWGIVMAALCFAVILFFALRTDSQPPDALMGVLSHGMLAWGFLLLSYANVDSAELESYLTGDIGDIVSLRGEGIIFLLTVAVIVITGLVRYWPALIINTIDPMLAEMEGHTRKLMHAIFMCLMALSITCAIQVVGVLLSTSLFLMPAVAARPWAASPAGMVRIAVGMSMASMVLGGWYISGMLNAPPGPVIVCVATLLCLAGMLRPWLERR